MDETDEVFNTLPTDSEDEGNFSELLKAVFKISEGTYFHFGSIHKKNVRKMVVHFQGYELNLTFSVLGK